jgi:hypothetical protein
MNAVLEKGEWVGELRQVTKGGTVVRVMSSWTLVRDDQRRSRSILCINTKHPDDMNFEQRDEKRPRYS